MVDLDAKHNESLSSLDSTAGRVIQIRRRVAPASDYCR